MTAIVNVFGAAGLTVSRRTHAATGTGSDIPYLAVLHQIIRPQRDSASLYLGGLANEAANILPEKKRQVRRMWACLNQFKWELNDMETAPFTRKEWMPQGSR